MLKFKNIQNMKKSLVLLAAAAAMVACSQNDVLVDNISESKAETAIGFATDMNTMTRAENSSAAIGAALEYYHPAFGVWGYKTVGTGDEQTVFNNQACTWTTTSVSAPFTTTGDWVYSPIRYWDKTAKYDFYAYAPATAAFAINTPATGSTYPSNHYLTLSTFTVDGKSLAQDTKPTGQYTAADAAYDLFADEIANNKDLMIADDVIDVTYVPQRVQLNFNHILSRLNINIKTTIPEYTAATTSAPASGATVTLNSIQIKNMNSTGAFDESAADNSTSSPKLNEGTAARWSWDTPTKYTFGVTFTTTTTSGSVSVSATTGDYVSSAAAPTAADMNVIPYSTVTANVDKFFYQGLIMPQTVECENVPLDGTGATGFTTPYLVIDYTIKYSETESETNVAYYNLAAVMSNGYSQYVVNSRGAYKTSTSDYVYKAGDNYYSSSDETTAYTTVYFKDGDNYQNASGETIYYNSADSKYYSSYDASTGYRTALDDPDVVVLGTASAQVPVTKAEADFGAVDTDLCDFTFCEGWQNNLTITISPLAILFDANVYKWDDKDPVGPLSIE